MTRTPGDLIDYGAEPPIREVVMFAAWTPEGLSGQMFMTLGRHLPPPPEGFMTATSAPTAA